MESSFAFIWIRLLHPFVILGVILVLKLFETSCVDILLEHNLTFPSTYYFWDDIIFKAIGDKLC